MTCVWFHVQRVLQELVEADEPVRSYDELEPRARELVDELRERQAAVVRGELDLEGGFDDFRVVLGDADDAVH